VQQLVERRITLDARQVTRINDNRPLVRTNPVVNKTIVNDERPIIRPTIEQTQLKVGTPGLQGIPGQSGGISVPPINFTFGEAPHAVWPAPVNGTFTVARVEITEEFDGTGASISAGTQAQPSAVMPPELNNPYELGSYETAADFEVAQGGQLYITIVPGAGATRGAGTLYVDFVAEN
jgi:hypothetical protein